ncbi:MAG TPA: hypothetical protein DCE18_04840 [Syntrophobacteraceae bacterium]|jgi:hypothetical protein|nr:hypothetical protein [Syntrophobacteraceae bacterium]
MATILTDDELRKLISSKTLYTLDNETIEDLLEMEEPPQEEKAQQREDRVEELFQGALATLAEVARITKEQAIQTITTKAPDVHVKVDPPDMNPSVQALRTLVATLTGCEQMHHAYVQKLAEISVQKPPVVNVKVPDPPAPSNIRTWRFEVERDQQNGLIRAIVAHPAEE